MSISKSFELPAHTIEAVAVAQDELLPALSQLKSISFELPVVLNVPVNVAPFTSNFKTLLLQLGLYLLLWLRLSQMKM